MSPRAISFLAVVACLCSTAIFVRRAADAWSAVNVAPGVALTSGFEEESLFAAYRGVHGQPIYQEGTRLPYASAYFNWLFYATTASAVKPFHGADNPASLIRAARLFTAVGSVAGLAILWWFGRRLIPHGSVVAMAIAMAVFFSPLVGWWAHTVRPDVWALACEASALVVLLVGFRRHPVAAVLLAMAWFYAAWAFKPTYVFGLGAAVVFLLVRRQFKAAAVLAIGSAGLWAATYAWLGSAYRSAMNDTAVTNVFYLSGGSQNLLNAAAKSVPLLLLVAMLGWKSVREKNEATASLPDDARWLGGIGVVAATLLGFITSCKLGAASNYFFTALLMSGLLALGQLARNPPRGQLAVFLVLTIALQFLVFCGKVGTIDLRPAEDQLAARWSVWERQPEPRFSADTRLNLPWLSPHSPPLVLAFNYPLQRAQGRPFEAGGVGGMIAKGYFAALLLPAGDLKDYDGAPLSLYRKDREIAGMSVYLRTAANPSAP